MLLKGRVGTNDVMAALAIKTWSDPGVGLSLCCGYAFGGIEKDSKGGLRFGATLTVENEGRVRCV